MQIKESIHQTLDQLSNLLHQISDETYNKSIDIIHQQTVGKHVRHIVEYYQCLIYAQDCICYDYRKRDELIENSIPYTLHCIEEIKIEIGKLNLNTIVDIKQLINGETIFVQTTLGRELLYCIDHSIHHFAIIKIALENVYLNLELQEGFGVAYSTLQYQKEK